MIVNRKIIISVLLAGVLASACGSRRDDADFGALSTGTGAVLDQGGAATVDGGVAGAADPLAAGGDVAADGSDPVTAGSGDVPAGTTPDGSGPAADAPGAPAGPATTGGSDPAPGGTTPAGGGKATAASAKPAAGGPNTASDVGVTATTIKIGNVISIKGLAGPDQFPPYYYGAAAYFNDLNARGGINGRKVVFQTCDDEYTQTGNVKCVRDFVDKTKVFAFVATACGVCDGLTYAADQGVPAVGGLATDFRSYALKHYWPNGGNPYPQNGKIGFKGKVYYGTGIYRFFKEKYNVKKAGIVYYDNAAPSKNAALGFAEQMKVEGIEPFLYGLNVALPQYDSAVLDMKSRGVTAVFDAIDITGNQNLCKSIDSNGLKLTAKVSSSAAWVEKVGKTFSSPCRKAIFSSEAPASLPYSETGNPEVAKFRAAMERYFPSKRDEMHQWSLDGWANAMQFADAAVACGAALTRSCLEVGLDKPYTARGLFAERSNKKINFDTQKTRYECTSIVQWDDAKKTFVNRSGPKGACYTTRLIGQNLS